MLECCLPGSSDMSPSGPKPSQSRLPGCQRVCRPVQHLLASSSQFRSNVLVFFSGDVPKRNNTSVSIIYLCFFMHRWNSHSGYLYIYILRLALCPWCCVRFVVGSFLRVSPFKRVGLRGVIVGVETGPSRAW